MVNLVTVKSKDRWHTGGGETGVWAMEGQHMKHKQCPGDGLVTPDAEIVRRGGRFFFQDKGYDGQRAVRHGNYGISRGGSSCDQNSDQNTCIDGWSAECTKFPLRGEIGN